MDIFKFETRKPDGRVWVQYSRTPFPTNFALQDPGLMRTESWMAPHLRYNAMRDEFVSISASRQDRPMLPPKEYCPLCPHENLDKLGIDASFKTEIPNSERLYEWAVFENMFPALALKPEGIGHCEVILYSPRHDSTLGAESLSQVEGLIAVWQDRSRTIGALPDIEQVFIFENKGPEIGVTLHHPHGQLYSFNHVPPFVAKEHAAAKAFHNRTGQCLICQLAASELKDNRRVVLESESLVAYVPEAARYPYEIHLTTKTHRPLFEQLNSKECKELALMLKQIIFKYDQLFGFVMPYIMAHHQSSSKDPSCPSYHWHIEFYPPYRSKTKLKYLAGVESGAGFFVNDTIPEEKAQELRAISCPDSLAE